MFQRFSLPHWLTIPYIVVIGALAALIGGLSYQTGSETVDALSNNLMLEAVARIEQAVDRHLLGSAAVLETAFPQGMSTSANVLQDQERIRQRFWAATALYPDPNNYVYYGNEAGQSVSMFRRGPHDVEWRVRKDPDRPRLTYALRSISDPLPAPTTFVPLLDPRYRPWYIKALTSPTLIWTAVYIDSISHHLVVTRAKRVNDSAGRFQGVVATDVELDHLNQFVRSLPLSAHGVAFIIEPDGQLIASSKTPKVRTSQRGENTRINASESGDSLQLSAYHQVQRAMRSGLPADRALSVRFDDADGAQSQLAVSRLHDSAGLDWLVVVASPRSDFMKGVTDNVIKTAAIAAGAAVITGLLGLLIVSRVDADLKLLAAMSRRVGEGRLDEPFELRGQGGIGELARSFREMQHRLRTDTLTGLCNREWLMRNLSDRFERGRRQSDKIAFGILFIDLNKFKLINDTLGHEAGNAVLKEVAQRLTRSTRATDMVARYAGDEFVVLLDPITDPATAQAIRAKIEATLREPLLGLAHQAPEIHFGAAVGLAMYPGQASDAEELVRLADQDMYRRKTLQRAAQSSAGAGERSAELRL